MDPRRRFRALLRDATPSTELQPEKSGMTIGVHRDAARAIDAIR